MASPCTQDLDIYLSIYYEKLFFYKISEMQSVKESVSHSDAIYFFYVAWAQIHQRGVPQDCSSMF